MGHVNQAMGSKKPRAIDFRRKDVSQNERELIGFDKEGTYDWQIASAATIQARS